MLPALGHELVIDASKSVAATCTISGQEFLNCTRCKYTEIRDIPALNHQFGDWKITIEPTCTEKGLVVKCCSICNKTVGEYVLSELNHSYKKDWQTVIAPTCTNTGIAIKVCENCKDIQTNTLDKVSHIDSDMDAKCDMCAISMPNNSIDKCSCNCHKGGISAILFKFILFFQKIFGLNKFCACGVAHY